MEKREVNPSILETNIFYLVIGILLLRLGSFVQSKEIYSGLIITEYLIILLPTIIYLKVRGYSLRKTLRLNKISLRQGVLIPLIVIFAYPVAVFLNYIFILILNNFTELKPVPIPVPDTSMEFILGLIVISLSPGICEETLFRGMIMSSYDKLGKKKAIILSAVLFGMFHFNLQNLIGPIFLGVIFGFIVYKTNSLYSSIIAHGTNNTIALVISYLTKDKIENLQAIENEAINISMGPFATVLSIIIMFLVAFISGTIAYSIYKALPKGDGEHIHGFEEYSFKVVDYLPLIGVLIIFVFFNYKFLFA